MKKGWLFFVLGLCIFLLGCAERVVEIQNTDDGKLRIDKQHVIDFYLGNDAEGVAPITQQCLHLIGNRTPDAVVPLDGIWDGYTIYRYRINAATIYIEADEDNNKFLIGVNLGPNHILASGIRIGSTEDALKRFYNDHSEYHFWSSAVERIDARVYLLSGNWHERYLITFEVDTKTGIVTDISYKFDW